MLFEIKVMVKVKPLDIVTKKWQSRAAGAVEDYKLGIQNPKVPWQTAAENAFDAWSQGVQQAITDKRYVGGVRAAGNAKWQNRALVLGASRYPEGIRVGVEEYSKKMGEVLRVIEGVALPPRGPRGSDANFERVKSIGKTLHEWKIAKKKGL